MSGVIGVEVSAQTLRAVLKALRLSRSAVQNEAARERIAQEIGPYRKAEVAITRAERQLGVRT